MSTLQQDIDGLLGVGTPKVNKANHKSVMTRINGEKVSFVDVQNKTEDEKAQARDNIGAASNILQGATTAELIFFKNTFRDFTLQGVSIGVFTFGTCRNEADIAQIEIKKDGATIINLYRPKLQDGSEYISGGEWENSGYSFSSLVDWDALAVAGRIFEGKEIDNLFAFQAKYIKDIIKASTNKPLITENLYSQLPYTDYQIAILQNIITEFSISGNPTGEFYFGSFRNSNDYAQVSICKVVDGVNVDICNVWRSSLQHGYEYLNATEYNNSGYSFSCYIDWDKLAGVGSIYEGAKIGVIAAFIPKSKSKLFGLKGLICGDSVTEANKYQKFISDRTGAILTTHAKGGAGMKIIVDGNGSDLPALVASDFNDKSFCTYFAGFNNRWMIEGSLDETNYNDYFMGEFNYSIDKLLNLINTSQNRNCKLLVILGHKIGKYPWVDHDALSDYPYAGQNWWTLTRKMQLKCQRLGIPTIDLFSLSGINEKNWDIKTVNTLEPGSTFPNNRDNLHLNDAGHLDISYIIQEHIERLF